MAEDGYRQTLYAIVPVWIAGLGSHAVLVYFALASFARYEGDRACHPSAARLAALSGISERSVRSALKQLREAGAIVVEERTRANGSQASNQYLLRMDDPGLQDVQPQGTAGHAPLEREGSLLGPELDGGETGRAPAREPSLVGKVVLGKRLTASELDCAGAILRSFNRLADRSVTLENRENLRLLVGRYREHPNLQPNEWERIIEANLADPWWDGPPTLNVIFSPRVFHIALERGKGWKGGGTVVPRRGQQSIEDLAAMAAEFEAEDGE